jgi:hypothetical protein
VLDEREASSLVAVSFAFSLWQAKFAMRQGSLASARKTLRCFALTRKFLPAVVVLSGDGYNPSLAERW